VVPGVNEIALHRSPKLTVAAFTAFYDANVLYPAELRNFLMHLALLGCSERNGPLMCMRSLLSQRLGAIQRRCAKDSFMRTTMVKTFLRPSEVAV
jgi:hypothetical protein